MPMQQPAHDISNVNVSALEVGTNHRRTHNDRDASNQPTKKPIATDHNPYHRAKRSKGMARKTRVPITRRLLQLPQLLSIAMPPKYPPNAHAGATKAPLTNATT